MHLQPFHSHFQWLNCYFLALTFFFSVLHATPPSVKLNPDDGEIGDNFGYAVALSENRAIVGAINDDDRAQDAGSVYIFQPKAGNWQQTAEITVPNATAGMHFGHSVAIDKQYIIIGATGDDVRDQDAGSAYIFYHQGQQWQQMSILTANDAKADDAFGHSVALSGNYAIVGAIGDDDKGMDAGSAYIFQRSAQEWQQVAELTADDAESNDRFGYSAALSGDYAIVGAIGEDNQGRDVGAAYIFQRTGQEWQQTAKLTADDAESNDRFGYSVALSGNYAIVGAIGDDTRATDAGSAYIFQCFEEEWLQIAVLTADDAESNDRFGYSVALFKDYAVVGAIGDDDQATDAGSAYIFRRSANNTWQQVQEVLADDATIGAHFGHAVAISDNQIIVGAIKNHPNRNHSGAAYIFKDFYLK